VEALACGTPVVAYGRGGARETVVGFGTGAPATGVFFESQTADAIAGGVRALEEALGRGEVTAGGCRAQGERFSEGVFREGAREAVRRLVGR
jgi:glycosyltransferase involved in cell wall biosynthesis